MVRHPRQIRMPRPAQRSGSAGPGATTRIGTESEYAWPSAAAMFRAAGPVVVTAADGYRIATRDVGVDLDTRRVASGAPVGGRMPLGTFAAGRMSADLNSRIPRPTERAMSGSRWGPSTISAITRRTVISSGLMLNTAAG